MTSLLHFFAALLAPLADLGRFFADQLAVQGHRAPDSQAALTAAVLVAALAIIAGASLWALWSHGRFLANRKAIRGELARSRALLLQRDAIIEGGGDAVVVMGADMDVPLSFGGGSAAMQNCLGGPDAAGLAASLERLLETGTGFERRVRTAGGDVAVRGNPIGRRAVLFFRRQDNTANGRAALDRLPMPVWLRDRDLNLIWVNRAFLAMTGGKSAEDARNVALHQTEIELARTVREFGGPVEARRYAMIGGRRCALTFCLDALPDGTIMGSALDVTDAAQAEARLKLQAEANSEMLDRLAVGVAVFGADRRLSRFNQAYAAMWGLPAVWLAAKPSADEILDRLRELRKLPEQRNFPGWKQDRLALFDGETDADEEYWHLPGGRSLKVGAQRDMMGGVAFLYEDVSDRLRLESSYTSMIRVQRATLDTLEQGVAVFGPDGRLKLHNAAFAQLWTLPAPLLAGEPHLKDLAALAERHYARNNTWSIIASAVSSAAPESLSRWGSIERSDGATISLSLVRLPDGATMVSFTDETGFERLEEMKRSRDAA